jgi:uncharacterized protein (DUF2164 family)
MQLGRGETIEDTAKVLSRMVDAVMIRANSHADVERFAQVSTVPVINGLTDKSHPCQIMADLLTIEEHRGDVGGKTIAWVGDGNNVCSSFIHAAPLLGFKLNIACPAVYHPDLVDLARAQELQGQITLTDDPREAVRGADVVVADTWVSMGDTDHDERLAALEPYQVDDALMDLSKPPTASSCTACRPTAARRSPTACWTARARWPGTRRRTASTPRSRCWPGASGRSARGAAMARIEFNKQKRDALLDKLTRYLDRELDCEASPLQAGFLLDFISEQMGPYYYNQGVQDAQQLFRDKLEDAVYEIEKPFVD